MMAAAIISIQAVSFVFDQRIMAKKAVKVPKIKWLEMEIICPESIVTLLPPAGFNSRPERMRLRRVAHFQYLVYTMGG